MKCCMGRALGAGIPMAATRAFNTVEPVVLRWFGQLLAWRTVDLKAAVLEKQETIWKAQISVGSGWHTSRRGCLGEGFEGEPPLPCK